MLNEQQSFPAATFCPRAAPNSITGSGLRNARRALDRNPFIVEIIGKLSGNSHPFWAFYYVFPAYRRQILQLQGEEMREIGH